MAHNEEQVSYWLESAKHDLDTAQDLFDKGRYDWCLFIGHLVLEKILKGYYLRAAGNTPPFTHSLPYLAEKAGLNLSKEQLDLLEKATDFNLETRYPDKKLSFYRICTREFAEPYFNGIKEFYKWMLKKF
jgi:HEPN domain-containing protein